MKTFILTEKPSQAKDFATALKDNIRLVDKSYYEGDNYIICSAAGHLIQNYNPEDYDEKFKSWNANDLPIIPEEFKYKPSKNTYGKYQTISKQLKRKDIGDIIVATDAEREGELIARLIFNQIGIPANRPNMFRFWTSSALTPEEILKGLKNKKPLKEYDSYYHAALVRQKADWIIGINATRAATLTAHGNSIVSLGRVQTPTLNILAKRRSEIDNFVPKNYYQIIANLKKDYEFQAKYVNEKNETINFSEDEKLQAYELAAKLKNGTAKILDIKKQTKTSKPPKLFSLSNLQSEASSKHKLSVATTTQVMQNLYDNKYTTYPRTSSTVLSSDMVDLAKETLKSLVSREEYSEFANSYKVNPDNKQVFNDKELSDHHAIIPTGIKPKNLNPEEAIIYKMICDRFIANFLPDYEYENTQIITDISGYRFFTNGNTPKKLGWKSVYKEKEQDDTLPYLEIGDNVNIEKIDAYDKQTTPPPEYTEGTLITAMKNPSSLINDEDLKKLLKDDLGLGTEATRAGIIETLKSRGFITNKKNQILITEAGNNLIKSMNGEQIIDPVYTALLEQDLDKILRKEITDIDDFMGKIHDYAKNLTKSILNKDLKGIAKITENPNRSVLGKCPACKGDVVGFSKSKAYNCSNPDCDFTMWRNKLSKLGKDDITMGDMKKILTNHEKGKATTFKVVSPNSGKEFEADFTIKHDNYGWGLNMQVNFDKNK